MISFIEQHFDNLMESDVGKSLLKNIPVDRIPMVKERLYQSFCYGVQTGISVAVIASIENMPAEDRLLIKKYLDESVT